MSGQLKLICASVVLTFAVSATGPAMAKNPKASPKTSPTHTASAVFPKAISAKYSKESPGKARMHTCLDQYKANKAKGANGGMKWIQKGGGYYSACNKRLKG